MAEDHVQKRLTAILAADVVGYGRINKVGTLSWLKTLRRELFDPNKNYHGGRIFKMIGDRASVEFNGAVEAVNSVLDIRSSPTTAPTSRSRGDGF